MQDSRAEKVFYFFNYLLLGLFACITLYPFLYVLSASISTPQAVVTGEVLLFPKGITWEAYNSVFAEKGIWIGYANTLFYTIVGTLVSMILTICGAYPLSKKD